MNRQRHLLVRRALADLKLTPAQSRIVGLLAEGYSITEAAGILGVRVTTVRTHLQRTYAALGVGSAVEVLALVLDRITTYIDRAHATPCVSEQNTRHVPAQSNLRA